MVLIIVQVFLLIFPQTISPAKLNVVVNNMATVMNITVLLLSFLLRILLGSLPIEVRTCDHHHLAGGGDLGGSLGGGLGGDLGEYHDHHHLAGGHLGLLQLPPQPHADHQPPHRQDNPDDTFHLEI